MKRISLFLALGIVFVSCDNTIDPFEEDAGIYSIYGVLDLNKQPNYIRITDLNAPFTAEATRHIDATVILENLQTGTSVVLEDEPLEFDGIYLHNFVVNGMIPPGTEYRLTAKRSDGASVSLEMQTPTRPSPGISPATRDCFTSIEISFKPTNGGTIVARTGFLFTNPNNGEIRNVFTTLDVLREKENGPKGEIIHAFIPDEVLGEAPFIPRVECSDLPADTFYVAYAHYSPGLYEEIEDSPGYIPGKLFDLNLLMRESGIFRFGAFYADTLKVPVDISDVSPENRKKIQTF